MPIVAPMENINENIQEPNEDLKGRDARLVALGRVIKQARETRNLTQFDLAALIDSSQSEISRIENGYSSYSVSKLIEISMALGGGTIEIDIDPVVNEDGDECFEYSFVILQDFGGLNSKTTELETTIQQTEEGYVPDGGELGWPTTKKSDKARIKTYLHDTLWPESY